MKNCSRQQIVRQIIENVLFLRKKKKEKKDMFRFYKKVNYSNIHATKIVILIPSETKYSRFFQTKFFRERIGFSK